MKVKDLIADLKERNQEGEVYIGSPSDDLLDIEEVTFGKMCSSGEEFTILPIKKD